MLTLKARIEEAMRRHPDLSQADIARACKVKTPSVADWLNGKTKSLKPEPARLAALLFGCDQNWIGTGVGVPCWRSIPAKPEYSEAALRVAAIYDQATRKDRRHIDMTADATLSPDNLPELPDDSPTDSELRSPAPTPTPERRG